MDYEILIRLLAAALCGGLIGAEREYRSKSAGFRTMIMISVGSCFLTIISMRIGSPASPDRIASNIVTGIGFLGAGVIFRSESRVSGLTTAAAIWAVAAGGMGLGAGYYFASAAAFAIMLAVLSVLPYLERLIDTINQSKLYTIQCSFALGRQQHFEELLREFSLNYILMNQVKEGDHMSFTWRANGAARSHQKFTEAIMLDELTEKFEY